MSKLRGKQHWQRVDADLKRAVAEREAAADAERQEVRAKARAARGALTPVDPAELANALRVRDYRGAWHTVERVNARTVTVAASYLYPFGARIHKGRVVEIERRSAVEAP